MMANEKALIETAKKRAEAERLTALFKIDRKAWFAHIRTALVNNIGNVTRAAEELGINHRQLWRLIAKDPNVLADTGHKENAGLVHR